jgi:ABC-2 type transport system permease protein
VVQFAGMMVMMPLMFLSAAFAPLATMPEWMRRVAALNPVEHAIEALRSQVLGTATPRDTASALAAAATLWFIVALFQAAKSRWRSHAA